MRSARDFHLLVAAVKYKTECGCAGCCYILCSIQYTHQFSFDEESPLLFQSFLAEIRPPKTKLDHAKIFSTQLPAHIIKTRYTITTDASDLIGAVIRREERTNNTVYHVQMNELIRVRVLIHTTRTYNGQQRACTHTVCTVLYINKYEDKTDVIVVVICLMGCDHRDDHVVDCLIRPSCTRDSRPSLWWLIYPTILASKNFDPDSMRTCTV